jgi:hypothetical protein
MPAFIVYQKPKLVPVHFTWVPSLDIKKQPDTFYSRPGKAIPRARSETEPEPEPETSHNHSALRESSSPGCKLKQTTPRPCFPGAHRGLTGPARASAT